jgi:Predicted periplasmic protein (DUF2092)
MCSGSRLRVEEPLGVVTIADLQKGIMMGIWHHQRRAIIQPISPEVPKGLLDFLTMLRKLPDSATKKVGQRQLDGQRVTDFVVRLEDNLDYTITVDERTKLPIRVEVVRPKRPETGQDSEIREVFSNFMFDAPLDEALFRIEPPAGYTVKNHHMPAKNQPPLPDVGPLVISPEDGIGPVKFGASVAEIIRLLGEPDWKDQEDATPVSVHGAKPGSTAKKITGIELGYDRRGFRLKADEQHGLNAIECFNQVSTASLVGNFGGKTKEGLRLGASRDEVVKIYGKPDAEMESRTLWYEKRGYRFEFRDKKLCSIHVKQPNPAIEIEVHGNQIIERVKPRK